jgi:hypothetical protein
MVVDRKKVKNHPEVQNGRQTRKSGQAEWSGRRECPENRQRSKPGGLVEEKKNAG